MILANYKPQEVLKHFEAISQIPRGSGNEKAVSDYIAQFAQGLGRKTIQDELNNLVIFKPASYGYEASPTIILQAHLDMVCEKNADTTHDFLNDPIQLYVDGDFVKARGTTLGADNGLGVALCMALLEESNLTHPPLEIVLTVDEEAGMTGADKLGCSVLKGRRMINLDNSEDSQIIMGCAAGTGIKYTIPVEWEKRPDSSFVYEVSVKGLIGGHSGADIHRERGNALRIIGQVLAALAQHIDISVASINGGMKVNAIPREATATIVIPQGQECRALEILSDCCQSFAQQYRATDAGLCIEYHSATTDNIICRHSTQKLISALILLPNGVLHMSTELDELVNSSCNIGVVETLQDSIRIVAMGRGAAAHFNQQMERQAAYLAKLLGIQPSITTRTAAWPYNPDSQLLKLAEKCYAPIFGHAPKVTAIHAGLECGLFSEKIDGLDIISIGATNHDLHTPDERLSISSTAKTWQFVKSILEAAK